MKVEEPLRFAEIVVRRPCVTMFGTLAFALLLSAVGMSKFFINTEVPQGRSAYGIDADIRTKKVDAFIMARNDVKLSTGNKTLNTERVNDIVLSFLWKSKTDSSVFTKDTLALIRKYNEEITSRADYQKICYRPSQGANCSYMSPTLYMYPSGPLKFDGYGSLVSNVTHQLERLAMPASSAGLTTAQEMVQYPLQSQFKFYCGKEMNSEKLTSSVTRTTFFFGMPLKGYKNKDDRTAEQKKNYRGYSRQDIARGVEQAS
jgi:hypothetical protein